MRLSTLSVAALALTVPTILGVAGPGTAATPTTYYFSATGSDLASGTSPSAPMRSLSKIASLKLNPGDAVRLQAGSTFVGGTSALTVNSSGTRQAPITLGSYGSGALPTIAASLDSCVKINGSFVNVTSLKTSGCAWSGFDVVGDNVNVDRVDSSGSYSGAQFEASATYGSLTNSVIHDNVRMKTIALGADDDSGAFGVLVLGDHTLVRGNTISGQDTFSTDYGRDGSAVEVYGATYTDVESNVASGNQTFVEVGGQPGVNEVDHATLTSNRVSTTASGTYFLVVHAGDGFGTPTAVRAVSNTVQLPGSGSVGVYCGPKCTPQVLALVKNTIAAAGGALYIEGTYATS